MAPRPFPVRRGPLVGLGRAVVLFGLTFLTATWAGWVASAAPLTGIFSVDLAARAWREPSVLASGLPFSLSLVSILLAHEMGHLVACLRHGVDASPPYFLPAPTLIGTFGAFIRIRSPLSRRHVLFDVGAAGPIAGFVATLAYLALGLATYDASRASHSLPDFGTPAIMELAFRVAGRSVPSPASLLDHPILLAAWVGCILTALNLLPVGQLDGGHVLHAMVGRWSRPLGLVAFAGLVVLFFVTWWPGWLVWSVLLLVLGLRHPVLDDPRPLSWPRQLVGLACFAILAACFVPHPVRAY